MTTREPPARDTDTPFIVLEGVEKAFGSNRVLRGVDLEIRRGEIFTLLGGSGTGKSVMLKHMVGLLKPDAGRIRIEGHDVSALGEREWVELRKRIAYVFQGAALFDSLNVLENVAYGLREHLSLSRRELEQRVGECLEAVGLEGVESRMPAELSGGMRKRVGVARAIALEPEAILYDEPTTGLDPANSKRIGQLIVRLRERLAVTSVVVTHDLDLCFSISDRVGLLGRGKLVEVGTPDEIRASRHPEVREFLEGELDALQDAWSGGVGEPAREASGRAASAEGRGDGA
jgi:phospholipid/cholesterol/gamma-HCH transport system ATP-binding protein